MLILAAGKRNEQETFTFRLGRGGWKSADDSNSLASHATYGGVAPVISILSLESEVEYGFGDVPLEFSLNRPVAWMGYSLDGGANVTVSGNVTLSGLSSGVHSVRVFVEDEYGNVGASETLTFSVASAPFSVLSVVVAVGVVVVCVGLLLFLRKHRRIKSLQAG